MPAATLDPAPGLAEAADDLVGRHPGRTVGDVVGVRERRMDPADRSRLRAGAAGPLRALPMADGTVRPVFEANVVNVASSAAPAYTASWTA